MGIKKKDNDNDLPPQHIGGSDSSENLDINYYGNSNQMLQNHYHDQGEENKFPGEIQQENKNGNNFAQQNHNSHKKPNGRSRSI